MKIDSIMDEIEGEIENVFRLPVGKIVATISIWNPWNDRGWARMNVSGGQVESWTQAILASATFAQDIQHVLNTPAIYGEAIRNDYYPDMILDFSMKMDGTAVSCRAYHKDRTMSPPVHSHYPSIREAFLGAASLYVKQRSSDG